MLKSVSIRADTNSMDAADHFSPPEETELNSCPWRMFQTAYEVVHEGALRAVIAQGTGGMRSAWHAAGKYVQGYIPVIKAAAHAVLDVAEGRVCIPEVAS